MKKNIIAQLALLLCIASIEFAYSFDTPVSYFPSRKSFCLNISEGGRKCFGVDGNRVDDESFPEHEAKSEVFSCTFNNSELSCYEHVSFLEELDNVDEVSENIMGNCAITDNRRKIVCDPAMWNRGWEDGSPGTLVSSKSSDIKNLLRFGYNDYCAQVGSTVQCWQKKYVAFHMKDLDGAEEIYKVGESVCAKIDSSILCYDRSPSSYRDRIYYKFGDLDVSARSFRHGGLRGRFGCILNKKSILCTKERNDDSPDQRQLKNPQQMEIIASDVYVVDDGVLKCWNIYSWDRECSLFGIKADRIIKTQFYNGICLQSKKGLECWQDVDKSETKVEIPKIVQRFDVKSFHMRATWNNSTKIKRVRITIYRQPAFLLE